jgi:hypothetical protein
LQSVGIFRNFFIDFSLVAVTVKSPNEKIQKINFYHNLLSPTMRTTNCVKKYHRAGENCSRDPLHSTAIVEPVDIIALQSY